VILQAAGENTRCLLLTHATRLRKQAMNTSERDNECVPETHNLLALDSRLPNQASIRRHTSRLF
jgi:hypothetical protein